MGEYAIRVQDGAEIKIGTCEDMLYLRFQDRDKVAAKHGSLDVNNPRIAGQLFFRLPFPDEDHVLPGEYENPFRGVRLWNPETRTDWKPDGELPAHTRPSIMQVHDERSGLLLNLPCYHGMKLPEIPGGNAHWNGKGHAFELAHLRCVNPSGDTLVLYPVVRCRFCRDEWRTCWDSIWDYIPDDLRAALLASECHRYLASKGAN